MYIFRWIGGPINLMKTIIKDNIEQVRRYNRGQNVCVVNPGIKHGYGLDKFLLDILRTFGYPTDFWISNGLLDILRTFGYPTGFWISYGLLDILRTFVWILLILNV